MGSLFWLSPFKLDLSNPRWSSVGMALRKRRFATVVSASLLMFACATPPHQPNEFDVLQCEGFPAPELRRNCRITLFNTYKEERIRAAGINGLLIGASMGAGLGGLLGGKDEAMIGALMGGWFGSAVVKELVNDETLERLREDLLYEDQQAETQRRSLSDIRAQLRRFEEEFGPLIETNDVVKVAQMNSDFVVRQDEVNAEIHEMRKEVNELKQASRRGATASQFVISAFSTQSPRNSFDGKSLLPLGATPATPSPLPPILDEIGSTAQEFTARKKQHEENEIESEKLDEAIVEFGISFSCIGVLC